MIWWYSPFSDKSQLDAQVLSKDSFAQISSAGPISMAQAGFVLTEVVFALVLLDVDGSRASSSRQTSLELGDSWFTQPNVIFHPPKILETWWPCQDLNN